MKADITSRADVEQLVNSFYSKVQADELLAPVFSHVDWPKHLPNMYSFWTFALLGEVGYKTNMVQKHFALPIQPEHFARWLAIFNTTVDENFSGAKADE